MMLSSPPVSLQNERLRIPQWSVLPTALLLCVFSFATNIAAGSKTGGGVQEPKPNAKTKTKDAPKLKPGSPVERETSGGQTHVYRLKLRAGQFARVTVEQRGVDVSMKLTGPNGEQLAEVNDKKGLNESEALLFVAEAKGNYLLEVSAAKEAAAGSYRAELAELRAATEMDRSRISAERKMSEADQLRADKKPESLRQAVTKYQEALALWRAAKDRQREADTLGNLGAVFSSLNEHQQARDHYNQALTIRRELKDRAGEGAALHAIGLVHNSMREYQQAISYFEQSLAIRRETGDERRQAITLANIGLAFYSLRDFQKAVDYCNQSLTLWRKLKDRDQEIKTLGFIASSYEAWDKRRQALEYFAQVRELRREMKDQAGEAETLLDLGAVSRDVGDNRKALEYFEAALTLWRAIGNRGREASTLNFLGLVNRTLGDKEQAANYYNQALALSRELKNQSLEATVLNNLGGLYNSLGDKRKAIENFRQAVALQQAAKNRLGEASALTNIGAIHADLGENEQALEFYNQALPIWRAANRRLEESISLNNLGETYDRLGEKQQALDYYTQALAIARSAGARQIEGSILTNIATVYSSLGERPAAVEYYQQALTIFRDVSDLTAQADIYHLLGYLYYELGDKQKALEYHNQVLPLWRKLGDKRGEANTLAAMGFVYRDLNESQKALELLNQALPLHREVGNRGGESDTLTHLGIVHNDLGEREKAIEYLKQSLTLAQDVTDPHREAKARFELARVQMALGDLADARTQIEETLKLVETIRSKVAGEHLRVAYFATVQRYYDLYIELLMRMNERRPGEGFDGMALQTAERARARSLLDLLAEARADIRNGVDPALLERERALQTLLSDKAERQIRLRSNPQTQTEADAVGKEIQTLATEYQQVRAQIRTASPRYAALTQPQPLTLAEIQKDALDADTLLLAYSLGEERSFLWAVTPNSIKSYSLPKRDVIEEAARKAYELVSAPRASRSEEGEGRRLKHEAGKEVEADATTVLNDLSRMLLAPAAAELGKKRLLVVAEGALQYVPFAALPVPEAEGRKDKGARRQGDKGTRRRGKIAIRNPQSAIRNPQSEIRNPLIAEHEIVSLPSASTIAVLRRELEGRRPAPKALALLADPVFEQDDERVKTIALPAKKQTTNAPPKVAEERTLKHLKKISEEKPGLARIARLPYTRLEAEEISALVPESERKESLDFEASRAAAVSAELGQYRFVHFATHGYLDSEQPELSALVLSLVDEHGARQNGFLRTHEIFNLKLPAELVTLSACETGLGKEIRGEGLVGLTRGFMYAGTARVVVSLWALNDRATAELMARFYRKMLKDGLRPAAALRAAQVEMSKEAQWQAPYFWAGFVLQGEWR
ncbi:MAG: Photosystem I assembly protein Ycf3 [Acidobacteria bacterium]|nr:Photosystem I assembly protein Ycf3 [Acidobacteriota bacterium]